MLSKKILLVDGDPEVIEAYRCAVPPPFQVDFAADGALALAALKEDGPYGLVLASLRLPDMHGAHLLAEVRHQAPDTVRMLVAESTDLEAAMEAVNEGNIFRLLAKPCEMDVLSSAFISGLEQYRLIQSERDLLENTLMGSIRTLNDVFSAASPEAFGRSMRISRSVDFLCTRFKLAAPWRFHVAATLSQLGCVTLDPDLVGKAYSGTTLTADEQELFDSHPQRAMEILGSIPRLEPVAWIIGQQLRVEIPEFISGDPTIPLEEIALGARMLKLVVTYEDLRKKVASAEYVMVRLRSRLGEFSEELIDALAAMGPGPPMKDLRRVPTAKLKPGMVLNQEIRNRQGLLVVARGQQLTLSMLFKLENFARTGAIEKEVMAFVEI